MNHVTVPPDTAQLILFNCNYFTIQNLTLSRVNIGLKLVSSSHNTISGNIIKNNNIYGIQLVKSSYSTITRNEITDNPGEGIDIYDLSNSNTISENNMRDNGFGIFIWENSNSNVVYHNNFIDNSGGNAYDLCNNIWNSSYPAGGNYWSDHSTHNEYHGPQQNILGPDTIVDQPGGGLNPYRVGDENQQDNYPLVKPYRIHYLYQSV
jgi:parallel beta-helix repeat protein